VVIDFTAQNNHINMNTLSASQVFCQCGSCLISYHKCQMQWRYMLWPPLLQTSIPGIHKIWGRMDSEETNTTSFDLSFVPLMEMWKCIQTFSSVLPKVFYT
jgi:hypothetical protein